jgi:hypothetical protein
VELATTPFREVCNGTYGIQVHDAAADPPGRHLRVGVLGAVFSVSALALVPAVASDIFGPVVIPSDEAVTSGQVVAAGVAGAGRAAVLFAVIDRITLRPIRAFWDIAAAGLLLSFLPIALAGVTGSSARTLGLMHVVSAATNVGLLTALARKG